MLKRLWRKIKLLLPRLRYIPGSYVIILSVMLIAALIIRLSTGGTHIIYNVLGHRGIFPSPFLYGVSFFIRTVLFTTVLYFCLYVQRRYCESFVPLILTLSGSVMLLLEYKLIFGGVSLILAMLFAVLSGSFAVLSVIIMKIKHRGISVCALLFAFLQLIFFIQLISLSVYV